jgi:hypothetical protein
MEMEIFDGGDSDEEITTKSGPVVAFPRSNLYNSVRVSFAKNNASAALRLWHANRLERPTRRSASSKKCFGLACARSVAFFFRFTSGTNFNDIMSS